MLEPKKVFLKSAIHFLFGAVLATLFFWTVMQGILLQLEHDKSAFYYYFLAFLSGIAAIYNYKQAKEKFHYAKLA